MSCDRRATTSERIAAGRTLAPVRAGRQERIGGRRGVPPARSGRDGRAEVAGPDGRAGRNGSRRRLRVGLMAGREPGGLVAGRRGFTLVEVLMVVVIIGLLIGLLLPAINSAVVRAREARVTAEIQNLSAAIADFKAQFGFEPPSSITLYEDPNGWNTNNAATRESRSVLRRMFPQIQLSNLDGDANPNEVPDDTFDFNHDNQTAPANQPITLNGAECLVFFLGGIQTRDDPASANSPVQVGGFAKNPRNPFSRTDQNRIGPFFSQFNTGRLTDVDGDGMSEFRDPLPGQTSPYLYVSSNDGRGYDTPASNGGTATPDLAGTGMSDVYRVSPPDTSGTPNPGAAHNPKSYQIISAGYDTFYGTGGYFDPNNPESSLVTDPLNYLSGFSAPRQTEAERDNITNFHLNRLSP